MRQQVSALKTGDIGTLVLLLFLRNPRRLNERRTKLFDGVGIEIDEHPRAIR